MSKTSTRNKIETIKGWLLQVARDNKYPKQKIKKRLERLINQGLIQQNGNILKTTDKGIRAIHSFEGLQELFGHKVYTENINRGLDIQKIDHDQFPDLKKIIISKKI